jgi:hypothetical protein
MPFVPLELACRALRRAPADDRSRSGTVAAPGLPQANKLEAWIGSSTVDRLLRPAWAEPDPRPGVRAGAAPGRVSFDRVPGHPTGAGGWRRVVRFTQTVGWAHRPAVPRPIAGRPYFHVGAISAWTARGADPQRRQLREGSSRPVPFRHSLYGSRRLLDVYGGVEFELGDGSPWGDEETPAFAAAVESELSRLATSILRTGFQLVRRRVAPGETLVERGRAGVDLFILWMACSTSLARPSPRWLRRDSGRVRARRRATYGGAPRRAVLSCPSSGRQIARPQLLEISTSGRVSSTVEAVRTAVSVTLVAGIAVLLVTAVRSRRSPPRARRISPAASRRAEQPADHG